MYLSQEAEAKERTKEALNLVGSTLGKYQVQEELGRGGMAVVYKGYNPDLQRTVALKVLPVELAADQEFIARFIHEARTAAQLKHPNIATVYDVEQAGDIHYIVMEFLPGHTLQQEVRHRGALPLKQIKEIIAALASALDYAHQRGFIHRDVKPSNIMIGPDGQVTLMDFGIVKAAADLRLTQEGMRIGTPEYMSPEQAQGKEVDHRSDIYSLGVVLYEMLVGRVPFQATSSHQVLNCHIRQEPPSPSQFVTNLPPAVEKVVLRALAKHPGHRFQTAGQLAAALEQAILSRSSVDEARRQEPKLKLVTADGRAFRLTGTVGLGRSSDNQVQIPDSTVSRYHAQIRCQGAHCQITDLNSLNGTFLNGEQLRPNVPYPLQPGDRLRLGPAITFSVEVGTTVEQPQKQPSATRGSTLRERVWKDKRSRTMALLSGGIALILLLLCLVVLLTIAGSSQATTTTERAWVSVVNATGHNLELEIGSQRWAFKAGQRRVIYLPPGEYDYIITLDNGSKTRGHGTWHTGDNGELQLVPRE